MRFSTAPRDFSVLQNAQTCFGISQPERDSDNLSPSSAEINNEWNFTSTSSYPFMAYTGRALPSHHVTLLMYLRLKCN